MSFDPSLYQRPFKQFPAWICPGCGEGRVRPLKGWPRGRSPTGQWDELEYEYTSKQERFVALMACRNSDCKRAIAVIGTTWLIPVALDELWSAYDVHQFFFPRFIDPAPQMFAIPSCCPESIRMPVQSAFQLFWCDPAAAVAKIRTSLERFMDEKRIPAQQGGRRMSLHQRLTIYESTDVEGFGLLREVKELGNLLVHERSGTDEDVLNSLRILDHILDTSFGHPRSKRELAMEAAIAIKTRRMRGQNRNA